MKQRLELAQATYGPMTHKTFEGAMDSFFQNECPQMGGARTRQVLVQSIQGLVQSYYPETSRLQQGQVQWTAVHKDEKASYGKSISKSRLTPVVLDLVQGSDAKDRAEGKKLREIKREAVARLFQQAYQQDGVLTNADLAVLLKISPATVGNYARAWEGEHGRYLPRRGVIHDLGPSTNRPPFFSAMQRDDARLWVSKDPSERLLGGETRHGQQISNRIGCLHWINLWANLSRDRKLERVLILLSGDTQN